MTANQKQQLDSLNIQIKQIQQDNKTLENKISNFNSEITKIDENISNIKNQKTLIREIYYEKISNVDKLTIAELDSFFANRYK